MLSLTVISSYISNFSFLYFLLDEHPHFLTYAAKLAAVLRHTVLVDQVRQTARIRLSTNFIIRWRTLTKIEKK